MQNVTVFVDWDTGRRILPKNVRRRRSPESEAEEAVQRLCARIADLLMRDSPGDTFRVRLRLYHGWHRGETPTEEFRVARQIKRSSGRIRNVTFAPEIEFGCDLLCGTHLDDTYRPSDRQRNPRSPGEFEQKMVDTALVSDLAWFARGCAGSSNGLAVIVADDDDMWPGVYTADDFKCRVRVLRITRKSENKHLPTGKFVWK